MEANSVVPLFPSFVQRRTKIVTGRGEICFYLSGSPTDLSLKPAAPCELIESHKITTDSVVIQYDKYKVYHKKNK